MRRHSAELLTSFVIVFDSAAVADDASSRERGEKIFQQSCVVCHQPTGQGVPPAIPPLAASDWIKENREPAIAAVCEGMSGRIRVNGADYDNVMPAQILDNAGVADVLTFVFSAWGNAEKAVTPTEVATVRATTKFRTFDDLIRAHAYQPLPIAPKGMKVREVAQVPEFCTRLAGPDRDGGVYVLGQKGSVFRLEPASGVLLPLIQPLDYLDTARGEVTALGIMLDPSEKLWVVTNQRIAEGFPDVMNEVVIHSSSTVENGRPAKLKPWFLHRYPFGVGVFNHGVSNIALGPDGMLYVSSGSRTDAGEGSNKPRFFGGGEVDTTACIWRIDPRAEKPAIEVYARGVRNVYGFAWDPAGNLFSVTNGPDANAPEEMDFVERGKHYGYPFQFSNWPAERRVYPHTPTAPEGLKFTLPVKNAGPAGGGNSDGLWTFDPHSSPAGMIWCGDGFPELMRNGFLVTRFGNLIGAKRTGNPNDVGFDLLAMRLSRATDGSWSARTDTVLTGLARPIDVLRHGPGRVLILEYTRPTNFKDGLGWLPGRIVELSPAP